MNRLIATVLFSVIWASGQSQVADSYALNGNIKIYYQTFGSGQPLLIINGGPGMNSNGFVTLAKALSSNANTIIYDQRGTGRSVLARLDSTTVTMKLMVDDLECLRRHLHINKWTILGHSFGGMLAAYYVATYPQHVNALILSSSGGIDLKLLSNINNRIDSKLTKAELDSLHYWDDKIKGGDTSYAAKLGRGRALAPAYVFNHKYIPIIAERLTQGNVQVMTLVWSDLQRIRFNCKPLLRKFTRPVLIIQGKQDIIDKKIALVEQGAFPHTTLVLMDRCVHYGWLDRPDIYLPEIFKFIQHNKSAG